MLNAFGKRKLAMCEKNMLTEVEAGGNHSSKTKASNISSN